MPVTSSGSPGYSHFYLNGYKSGFSTTPPSSLIICYNSSQNSRKHCPYYLMAYHKKKITKDPIEEPNDKEHNVKKGPKHRSFCPHGVLGVPISSHVDVFTNLEGLQIPSFRAYMEVQEVERWVESFNPLIMPWSFWQKAVS